MNDTARQKDKTRTLGQVKTFSDISSMLAQYRCHGWWLAALTLYYGDQGNHRALQGGHGSSYLPDIILRFMLLRALPPAAAAAARGAAVGEAAWI